MIALELYRVRIGCFCGVARCKLKSKKCCSANFSKPDELPLFYTLQICIIFVYLITFKFNINMSFLKLAMLLIDGDIESNPGPTTYVIKKSVSGSFHQAHTKFGDSGWHSMFL